MTRYLSATLLLAGTFALTGCPPPNPGNDGGSDAGRDTAADTGSDTGSTSMLFKVGCTRSTECGAGLRCELGYPGGLCTRACTSDTVCQAGGANGVCALNPETNAKQCYPGCSIGGGLECDPFGGSCAELVVDSAAMTSTHGCSPSCFAAGTTAPTDFNNTCAGTRMCDPLLFQCVDQVGQYPGTKDIGDACASPSECKTGLCFPESSGGQATGFVGGYCTTFDARYPGNSFQPNQPYPRGNCPMGTGALALERGAGTGDQAACFGGCTRTAPTDLKGTCRAGYECTFATNTGMTASSSTGFCDPIDCNDAKYAAVANKGCPTGYTCQNRTTGGTTIGLCTKDNGG